MSRPVIEQEQFVQSLEEHAKWFEKLVQMLRVPESSGCIDFSGALIRNVNIRDARLTSAVFIGCEFVDCVFVNCDLSDVLFGSSIFKNVSMTACDFYKSELNDASCDHVNFAGSRFTRAECIGTSMVGANLTDCDFSWAVLIGTDMRHANLSNVDFDHTRMVNTKIFNRHKYAVKNLDTANIISLDASPDGEGGLMGGIELFKDFLV